MSYRVNTRARRLSQEREDSEEVDHTSCCSSAEAARRLAMDAAARRLALDDARDSRLEDRLLERRQNAIQWARRKLTL
jgi:hypothetical protein